MLLLLATFRVRFPCLSPCHLHINIQGRERVELELNTSCWSFFPRAASTELVSALSPSCSFCVAAMMARWKFGLPPCGQVAPSHAKECSPVRVTAYACSLKAVLIMIHERCQQLCPKRENTELGQEENMFLREEDHNLKSSTLISERNTTHFA